VADGERPADGDGIEAEIMVVILGVMGDEVFEGSGYALSVFCVDCFESVFGGLIVMFIGASEFDLNRDEGFVFDGEEIDFADIRFVAPMDDAIEF